MNTAGEKKNARRLVEHSKLTMQHGAEHKEMLARHESENESPEARANR